MKQIPLTRGKFALVDDEDFERFSVFKWYALKAPYGNFYAKRDVGKGKNRKTLSLSGEILGVKGADHKNGNGLDNRRENIRPATKQQNARAFQRKSLGTSSRFRGVSWAKQRSKWEAYIKVDGRKIGLGLFTAEVNAARAFDSAAKKFGFFNEALNFPNKSTQ